MTTCNFQSQLPFKFVLTQRAPVTSRVSAKQLAQGFLQSSGWKTTTYTSPKYSKHKIKMRFKVPPDILDSPTSTDMAVREGKDVTLRCAATGSPLPTVSWRRETNRPISLGNGTVGRKISSLRDWLFQLFSLDLFKLKNLQLTLCRASLNNLNNFPNDLISLIP